MRNLLAEYDLPTCSNNSHSPIILHDQCFRVCQLAHATTRSIEHHHRHNGTSNTDQSENYEGAVTRYKAAREEIYLTEFSRRVAIDFGRDEAFIR
jgi:hypothetical protein